MKLSKIILEQNTTNEELNVAKRKLEDMLQQTDADFIIDKIMSIEDENVLDVLVAALENPNQYRLEEDGHGEGYEEGNIKLMGDMILPIDKEMVLQAQDDKYNRGLLVTSKKDRSYDVAYWADKFEPYPIEVEIDGKSVAKEAKVIKLLFHPEMD